MGGGGGQSNRLILRGSERASSGCVDWEARETENNSCQKPQKINIITERARFSHYRVHTLSGVSENKKVERVRVQL